MAWDDWTDGERDVFLPESRPFWRDQFPDVLIAGLPNPHPRRGDLFPAMEAAAMLEQVHVYKDILHIDIPNGVYGDAERLNRSHAAAGLMTLYDLVYLAQRLDPGRESYSVDDAIRMLENRKAAFEQGTSSVELGFIRSVLVASKNIFLLVDSAVQRELNARVTMGMPDRLPTDDPMPVDPAGNYLNAADMLPPVDREIQLLHSYATTIRQNIELINPWD